MTAVWAHRGTSSEMPENTLEAFALAIEQGADGFELDVQRSADGELVVCHDETVDRTSDGTGAIVELALAELRRLELGRDGLSGVRMPTLREVFELVRGTDVVVNVELKNSVERYAGMEAAVLELVAEFGIGERIWLSSFNHYSLAELAGTRLGGVRLGVLYCEPLFEPWAYATSLGVQAIHPPWETLVMQPEVTERCHEAGMLVHPWTVNEVDHLAAVIELGVDAVITNWPKRALGLVSR